MGMGMRIILSHVVPHGAIIVGHDGTRDVTGSTFTGELDDDDAGHGLAEVCCTREGWELWPE